jgi:hypothetical protein
MASTAAATVVAQIIPAPRKAEGISYYSMSTTLATAKRLMTYQRR